MTCMAFCETCGVHTAHTGDARRDVGRCLEAAHEKLMEESRRRYSIPPAPLPEQRSLFPKQRTPK